MRFIWTQTLESTQTFLLDYLKRHEQITTPFVVATREQTNGIGSRLNTWQQVTSGLYFSCAIHKDLIPKDLPLQSSSIYFGMLFLELFRSFCNDLWLKWPNDFYLQDEKVGGLLTQTTKKYLVFGIGLNLLSEQRCALFNNKQNGVNREQKQVSEEILYQIIKKILHFLSFKSVEFDFKGDISYQELQGDCKTFLYENTSWQAVFGRYKQEFYKNSYFYAHIQDDDGIKRVSLKDAHLQTDGSIMLGNKILFSLR